MNDTFSKRNNSVFSLIMTTQPSYGRTEKQHPPGNFFKQSRQNATIQPDPTPNVTPGVHNKVE
jgi:hypothetical protein